MTGSLTIPCPHCGRALRLPPGRQFRCKWPACGRAFTLRGVEPTLKQFGLTPELVDQLQRPCPTPSKSHFWILVALFALSVIVLLIDQSLGAAAQVAVVVAAVSPLLLAYAFWKYRHTKKRKEREHDLSTRRNTHYSNLLRYEARCREYADFLETLKRVEYEQLRANERWWKRLDGRQFERELASLYRKRGYEVRSVGGPGDGGVDVILQREGRTILVQCKAHRKYISPGAVRELYGTLVHYRASEAWLVASRGFHRGAKEFAKGKPIRLLTIRDVLHNDSR